MFYRGDLSKIKHLRANFFASATFLIKMLKEKKSHESTRDLYGNTKVYSGYCNRSSFFFCIVCKDIDPKRRID